MIAKNNIFNIRQGAKWQGMTGTKKGFVEFETQEYAMLGKAMAKMETATSLHPNDILEVMNQFKIRVV